jgi:hypothetical protein
MLQHPEQTVATELGLLHLIERIYDGVGKEDAWPGILDSLNEAVGAEQTLIFSPIVGSGATVSTGTPLNLVQDFLLHHAKRQCAGRALR